MEHIARLLGTVTSEVRSSWFVGVVVLFLSGCVGSTVGMRAGSLPDLRCTNAIKTMLDAQPDFMSTGRRVDLCQLPIWLGTDRLVVDPTYLNTEVELTATDRTVREVIERVERDTSSICIIDPWGQILYVGRHEAAEHARSLEVPLGKLTGSFTNEESVCGVVQIWDLVAACNDMLVASRNDGGISRIVFDNRPPSELMRKQASLTALKLEDVSLRSLLWAYATWWRAHATYDNRDRSLHFHWDVGVRH